MPAELLPSEIVRHLSTHGEVLLTVGRLDDAVATRCLCAPFEEELFLFVRPDSPTDRKLLQDTRAVVQANDAEKGYVIRLRGRAVAGPRVMGHPRRMELLHWMPEGAAPRAWVAVPFWAEEIEYQRGSGSDAARFAGPTEAGKRRASGRTTWFFAAFSGTEGFAMVGLLGVWAWLIAAGPEFPLRGLAVVLASLCIGALIASINFWYRQASFLKARGTDGRTAGAPWLADGLLAPVPVFQACVACAAAALVLSIVLVFWGGGLLAATLLGSFIWFIGPLRLTQIFRGEAAETP
ncbi:MAG: hypothetical protein H6739_24270 [Alphaproteobacteria bacterium]|nr:hypothetical protein [Alphaproteobacteria bacterium]